MELQFVATEIDASPHICNVFHKKPEQFDRFFQVLNGGSNLIFVEATVNSAKGKLLAGGTITRVSTVKAGVRQLLPH